MNTAKDSRRWTSLAWVLGSGCVTVLAYLLILGWNKEKTLAPEEPGSVGTQCVGPYEPWQVVTLGLVLAAVVVVGTLLHGGIEVPATVVLTLVVLYIADAVTVKPCGDDLDDLALLPVGAFLLLTGSSAVAALLFVVTHGTRTRRLNPH